MESESNDFLRIFASGIVGAVAGAFVLLSVQEINKAEAHTDAISAANHPVPNNENTVEDPYESFEKMRSRFIKDFDDFEESFLNQSKALKKPFNQQVYTLNRKEEENFLVYEIDFKSEVLGESVNVNVENGMVTISGQKETKRQDDRENGSHFYSSTSLFSQSFSIPQGVDADRVMVENHGQKILLKFPKYRGEV